MKKLFIALLIFSNYSFAGTIFSEDQTSDLDILISGDIVETYKITLSNDNLDDSDPLLGLLNFTPNSLHPVLSYNTGVCKDANGTTITYIGPQTNCTVSVQPALGSSYAEVSAVFLANVELAGSGTIDLTVSLLGNQNSDSAFANSYAFFTASSGQTITGLIDTSTDLLIWGGRINFNEGPTFEETLVVDVIKN